MTTIETERLTIRNFLADDWRDLQEMILLYQASESAQYDHGWPTGAQEIQGIAEWFASGDRYLAVCLKRTGKLVGFIALNRGEEEKGLECHLGYVFHERYQGQGYATEGCRAAIDYAFGSLAAERVVSSTAAENVRSCQLLKRLGMRETGRSTGSFRQTEDGEPIEFEGVSFCLSREEWSPHRRG